MQLEFADAGNEIDAHWPCTESGCNATVRCEPPTSTRPAANETRGERDPRGRPDILAGEHACIAVRISEDR